MYFPRFDFLVVTCSVACLYPNNIGSNYLTLFCITVRALQLSDQDVAMVASSAESGGPTSDERCRPLAGLPVDPTDELRLDWYTGPHVRLEPPEAPELSVFESLLASPHAQQSSGSEAVPKGLPVSHLPVDIGESACISFALFLWLTSLRFLQELRPVPLQRLLVYPIPRIMRLVSMPRLLLTPSDTDHSRLSCPAQRRQSDGPWSTLPLQMCAWVPVVRYSAP